MEAPKWAQDLVVKRYGLQDIFSIIKHAVLPSHACIIAQFISILKYTYTRLRKYILETT